MINARKQIRYAIARRDYTLLEAAVERAYAMGYKWSELHEASTLCLVLQAESDARKELQKLVEIVHHKLGQPDYDVVEYVSPYLQQMVHYAVQDLNMSWDPIVQEARAQMGGVVEYATALESLRAAIHQLDLPTLKASVNAVVRAQERLGDFCAQDVTIARQWITKLDNEDHAVRVLQTLLSECLLSPFLLGSGEPTKDQLSEVTADKLFNRDKGEDLEVAYDFLQQTAPVTPSALSLLEEAKGLIHLRSLAEDKMWEALQAKISELRALDSNNYPDGSSAVLTPRVKAELRCYEIIYAAHVLLPPLLAALNQGQAVGTVGEVDTNAVEAGLGVLFEALNDMVASWQYGIWLQSIHAQANEAYRLRCAWLAQDWVGMEAAVKAGQELTVADLIDAELTMAALEVSDRNNQMKLRGLIALDVAADEGVLKPLSSDDIAFLKTLRALAEESPHCLSKITKRLLGSMVFLDDVRRCILESKWFHLYKFYYGLEILYEDCDDNTELEAMEELSQFVRILDTACQPVVEATRLLATTRLVLDTLKPPLDCGRTTGSATGLRFAAPDMNDSLRDVIDYCHGLQHLNAAAEELIAIAEVVLDVRETGTSASSNSIGGAWADLEPKLVQHSQWIDYLVEGEPADPLDVRLEVTLIRSHVQFQATFNSLVIALEQGGPSGLPQALDVSKIDVQPLEQALAGCASLLSNEAHSPYFLEEEQATMASWQTYASAIFHVRRHLQRDEVLPALEAIRDVSLTSAAIKLNEDLAASLQRELKEVQDHISTEVTVKLCQQALAFTRGVPPEKRDASCLEQSKKMVDYAKEIGQRYGFKGAEAQELHGSIVVLSDLRAAQLAGDMDAMSDLLERCEHLEVMAANSTLIVELELARKQIADEISLKQIRTALAIGRIKGRAGNLNTANIRVDQLEQALSLSSESDGCSYGLIYMQQLAQA